MDPRYNLICSWANFDCHQHNEWRDRNLKIHISVNFNNTWIYFLFGALLILFHFLILCDVDSTISRSIFRVDGWIWIVDYVKYLHFYAKDGRMESRKSIMPMCSRSSHFLLKFRKTIASKYWILWYRNEMLHSNILKIYDGSMSQNIKYRHIISILKS